jgi:hypothetical protein
MIVWTLFVVKIGLKKIFVTPKKERRDLVLLLAQRFFKAVL